MFHLDFEALNIPYFVAGDVKKMDLNKSLQFFSNY